MKIKGYVVRGKANDAPVFYVGDGDFAYADVGDGEAPKTLNTISDSSFAVESMEMDGCTDVRIFAVSEDGTETPQPTYAEALEQLAASETGRAAERKAWARLLDAEINRGPKAFERAAEALADLGVDVDALLAEVAS